MEDTPERTRLVDYEILELATLFRAGHTTSVEVTQEYLRRIDEFNGPFETYDENGGYNAFVRVDHDAALQQATDADARLRDDPQAPLLCGIPVGAKDSIAIQGMEAKNGTHLFDGNLADKDAAAVAALRSDGAVVLGHTIASEFSTHTTGTFAGNAWDPRYIPGGSSQGSGVAPIARLAAAAIGVETGGSIVTPAACNGVSAIKPTLGLVSESGVMQGSPGMDVAGPMARSMRDASLLLNAMTRFDQRNNPATLGPAPTYPLKPQEAGEPLAGLHIGIPQSDWMGGTSVGPGRRPPADTYDTDYRTAFERCKEELRALGAEVYEFEGLDLSDPDHDPFSNGELQEIDGMLFTAALANRGLNQRRLRQLEAVRAFAETRPNGQELIYKYAIDFLIPRYAQLSFATQLASERRRRLLCDGYQAALEQADVDFMLVLPLGAHIPVRFQPENPNYEPSHTNQRAFYSHPNLMGWPMVTFPIGLGNSLPLPITAAFWGPRFSEPLLTQATIDYQHHYPDYHHLAPPDPLFGPATKRPPQQPRVGPLTSMTTADPLGWELTTMAAMLQ
ncbi:amidase [Streptomyces sp. WZ-12]|uniref:amidase n=1 Tax=Streptomyces sp. WZ-12 TaxID=3030210 RepID=UPI002380C74B|nr:amidase [Streptomyces sp. WZ-12]